VQIRRKRQKLRAQFQMLARKTLGRLNCKIKKRQVSVLHALRRPYICPHDTRTTRILRTGNTAASLSFDRCGADAVRQAREPRRLNPPDGPRPPQTWMPHASCARRPAPSDERQSDQGKNQAAPTGFSTGSGLQPAFPAKARSAADREPRSRTQAVAPLIPTNFGIQGGRRTLPRVPASSLHPRHNRSWIPAFVGMRGSCFATSA